MRLRCSSLLGLAALLAVGCSQGRKFLILPGDLERLADNVPWRKRVDLGHNTVVGFLIEKSSKGNGTLWFPGGMAHVYDTHNDGATFEPSSLSIRLVDLSSDGYLDLELRGKAILWDEKGDLEIGIRPVAAIFLFVPSSGQFSPFSADELIEIN